MSWGLTPETALRGQVKPLLGHEREARRDHPLRANAVDDIDAVVLAIRARDPEEERQPPPEAEAPFLRELLLEDELVAFAPKITTWTLQDTVQVDLELARRARRKFDPRSPGHPP